ncbi:MAG: spirocyclase AveC family protein [Proteobacteria bacterium]|nr:spirocyclase AveC family protein [Pseudomonadota bacterium]
MFKKILVSSFLLLLIVIFTKSVFAETERPNALNKQSGKTIGTVGDVSTRQASPKFDNPSYIWIQEIIVPIISLIMLAFFITQSVRGGAFTFGALLYISATTMFWQEWYADWGAYLLFNPAFSLMPWGSTLWTAPNKPWAIILSYGPFFATIYLLMLALINKFHKKYPNLGKNRWILVVVIPSFYLFDLLVEGFAASQGWWSYTDYIGPAIATDRGNFPVVYPIALFVLYGVITTWILGMRGPDERVRFESWFGVDHIQAGFGRELARLGVWILVMNGLFLLFSTGPFVAVRALFGHASTLVP